MTTEKNAGNRTALEVCALSLNIAVMALKGIDRNERYSIKRRDIRDDDIIADDYGDSSGDALVRVLARAGKAARAALDMIERIQPAQPVTIDYTNYRGERAIRTITPHSVEWGSNCFHREPQWILKAYDHGKKAGRTFALRGIHSWDGEPTEEARSEPRTQEQILAALDRIRPAAPAIPPGFTLVPVKADSAPAETMETIARWADETFGPVTHKRIATRAMEEMVELLINPSRIEEAADVVICLSRYPGLWEAVERKMRVNRARKWRMTGDGVGYHIPDAEPEGEWTVEATHMVEREGE